jgi:hypothetical protein
MKWAYLAQRTVVRWLVARPASIDILPALKGEDSYGLLLFLQDDFGGFLFHRAALLRHSPQALDRAMSSPTSCDRRMITQNCALYPRSQEQGFTAHQCNKSSAYLAGRLLRMLPLAFLSSLVAKPGNLVM